MLSRTGTRGAHPGRHQVELVILRTERWGLRTEWDTSHSVLGPQSSVPFRRRMTDPIADMLTRVRNAYSAKHQKVDVPLSKLKVEIARILKDEGFINNYKVIGEGARRNIRVYLRYGPKGEQVMSKIERVSKP